MIVINSHQDHDQDQDQNTAHRWNTRPPEKRGTQDNTEKPAYICMIAADEKKYKKVKKNLELREKAVSLYRVKGKSPPAKFN